MRGAGTGSLEMRDFLWTRLASSGSRFNNNLAPSNPSARSSGEEGPEISSGGEGPEISSGGEGPEISSGGEGPEISSGGEGPEISSGEEGPEISSGEEGPEISSGGEGAYTRRLVHHCRTERRQDGTTVPLRYGSGSFKTVTWEI